MKGLTITKKQRVDIPESQRFDGIVAVQLIEYKLDFFGANVSHTLDTKILEDGRQLVIDGDGFIPAGFELTEAAA